MSKNINVAVDDFLGDLDESSTEGDPLKSEEQNPFDEEIEKSDNLKKENEGDDDDRTEIKSEPFHKDPKVQRYVQKEIAKALEGIQKPQSEVDKFVREATNAEDDEELDDIITRMIGNDTAEKLAVGKDFKKVLKSMEARGASKAMSQFQAAQAKIAEEDEKASNTLAQGFEDIEIEYGVDLTSGTAQAKKTRSDLVDFIKRVAPKNSQGQVIEFPDFNETFKLFQELKKTEQSKTTNRAKELANRGMSRSTTTSSDTKVKDNSWSAVDRLFSKFSS